MQHDLQHWSLIIAFYLFLLSAHSPYSAPGCDVWCCCCVDVIARHYSYLVNININLAIIWISLSDVVLIETWTRHQEGCMCGLRRSSTDITSQLFRVIINVWFPLIMHPSNFSPGWNDAADTAVWCCFFCWWCSRHRHIQLLVIIMSMYVRVSNIEINVIPWYLFPY